VKYYCAVKICESVHVQTMANHAQETINSNKCSF